MMQLTPAVQPSPALQAKAEDSERQRWREVVARYQKPSLRRASWQVINTLVPYVGTWVLMVFTSKVSLLLTLPLAVLAGGLLVRTFILFHDCCHGSFFKSQKANDVLGRITGLLTYTPYAHWRWEHALHHATSGNLSRRGIGDIWTMTVQEYKQSPRFKRFCYRLVRHPLILFGIGPIFLLVFLHRAVSAQAPRRERRSVHLTNLGVTLMVAGLVWLLGWKAFLLIQLTVLWVVGSAGIWLFYVQHQFEGTYWEKDDNWDFVTAALKGSSYYRLPKILQWFSGNIGFHHIHHLSARIPNYHLERAHLAEPLFQSVHALTLRASLASLGLRLWDEDEQKLVGFR
ncbi:MAG: fatty acid desaturase [Oligoflexia bacterium]